MRSQPRGMTSSDDDARNLRISVHSGPNQTMISMATIDLEDIFDLDLPTLTMKPPVGDQFPEVREDYDPTPAPVTPGLTFSFTPTESTGNTPDLNQIEPEKV